MRCFFSATLVALATLTLGCSKSDDTAAPQAAKPVDPPNVAVHQFLESIRTGDDKKAEAMLTDMARQKTAQMDLMVAPPGSPSASFKIGEMEVVDGQVAHVSSIWTDTGDDGKPQTNEFVWALRLEPQGWRIAGVAVALFPGQPPLLLDFEDPADMLRKQQMAEAEVQRQMNPQATPGAQNMQAGGTAAAQGTAPGQVQTTGATGPAMMSQPGNLNVTNSSAMAAPPLSLPGTIPPGPLPAGPAVGENQIPPGNLPPVGPYAPATPLNAPAALSPAPVPFQADQPQPSQSLPR